MSRESDLNFIEAQYNVNIDVTDEDGCTRVYTYTTDGDHIGFEFNTMNPLVSDVLVVAQGIDGLRTIANKRPRVGRPGPE
jgi:hypothetical protein